ncbi:hypothetical protein BJI67_16045 (plasmid) [Acidihalobacter aeolianus]|uniref:MPN domain-containing protein n=2 Tax=Acidihalobacter aeolianus TaxID=2792603 RepID=A0A1D8KD11_9GAMM|nr:hypothetical protein BJI67_16045 [Acidihalobacter aeolianus]
MEKPFVYATEDEVIEAAKSFLDIRGHRVADADFIESPALGKDIALMRLQGLKQEVFGIIWLTNRHRVIAVEEMFYGTINQCAVYPREIVRKALEHGACAALAYHNHPSGGTTASSADRAITDRLKSALALIDVRLLDHFIVGGGEVASLAEQGYM